MKIKNTEHLQKIAAAEFGEDGPDICGLIHTCLMADVAGSFLAGWDDRIEEAAMPGTDLHERLMRANQAEDANFLRAPLTVIGVLRLAGYEIVKAAE